MFFSNQANIDTTKALINSYLQQVVYVYVATIFVYIMFFCNQANIDTTKELMKGVVSSVYKNFKLCFNVYLAKNETVENITRFKFY